MGSKLTPKEIEILDLIKLGYADKQIASKLGIASGTIKDHLQLIFARLSAANRTDAVVKALNAGYIKLNEEVGNG